MIQTLVFRILLMYCRVFVRMHGVTSRRGRKWDYVRFDVGGRIKPVELKEGVKVRLLLNLDRNRNRGDMGTIKATRSGEFGVVFDKETGWDIETVVVRGDTRGGETVRLIEVCELVYCCPKCESVDTAVSNWDIVRLKDASGLLYVEYHLKLTCRCGHHWRRVY